MNRIILVCALLLSACKCAPLDPAPAPVPTPSVAPMGYDAGTVGAPYRAACDNMKALGCSEGAAFDCAAVMAHGDAIRLTLVPVQCLITATSKDGVRGCGGFVKCQ